MAEGLKEAPSVDGDANKMEQSRWHFNDLKAKYMWETFVSGWVFEWEENFKKTFNSLLGKQHNKQHNFHVPADEWGL